MSWDGRITISRDFLHRQIAEHVWVAGRVLDVGGGGRAKPSSYWAEIKDRNLFAIIETLDLNPHAEPDHLASAEDMPLPSGSYEAVLAFDVLEHVEHPDRVVCESRRVLKPGGVFYGHTPFLKRIHYAPDDYWRYTESALRSLLLQAGFSKVEIIVDGGPFRAIGSQLGDLFRGMAPRVAFVAVGSVIDRLIRLALALRRKMPGHYRTLAGQWAIGYFFIATAPDDRA